MPEKSVALLFRPHGHIEILPVTGGYTWRAEWWNPKLTAKQSYTSTRVYCAFLDAERVASRWYGSRVLSTTAGV